MSKTLGQVGYETWRSLIDPAIQYGLPTWDRLPAAGQAGWQDVAEAIVAKHIDDGEPE